MTIYIPLPGNETMAAELANITNSELGVLEYRRFPDEETYVRIGSNVAGKAVELVCTLARPDPQLPGLLFAAYTARELGASSVGLIAPYLAYMRQDKRFSDGEAVSSGHFARLLSGAFDRIVTVDPHLHRIHSLDDVFSINSKVVHAAPALADWIRTHVDKPLIIGPDSESEQWASEVARRANAPHLVLSKVRHGDRSVEVTAPGLENWTGYQPVLVDDIASSGRTMIEASLHFETAGLSKPICVVVHPLFAGDAYEELKSVSTLVVSTNAISHASNKISITPLLVS